MKRILTIMLFAGTLSSTTAQTRINACGNEWLIQESRRLHADKEFPGVLNILSRIERSELSLQQLQEVDYALATATFEINPLEGRAMMLQYLSDYPESSKREILAALIAESYYYCDNYSQACNWFAKSNFERLSPDEREKAELYYALSLQECGEKEKATNILNSLKLTGKRYASDAVFHLAAIDYYDNRLQSAYQGFKSIEMDDKYHLEVPYYLAGIYLKNQEYVRAEKVARLFLSHNADKKQGVAMRQILGGALFGKREYNEAVKPLKEYIEQSNRPQRIAYYQLAMSYFETGRFHEAVPMFDKCTDNSNDILAQNSYLHLGIIQLKLNDITKARLAFEQAAAMNHDNRVREEALYNYALCIHQTRYSPFAESVKVFERFLNEYPDSPHADKVGSYLVEVYMNTRNYDVALQSINKIKKPTTDILGAKQKVLYRMGVQAFIDNDMSAAIEYMNQSLSLARYNSDTHCDALYWRGEAYYRMNNYKAAAKDYRAMLSMRNSADALYSLAYTQFQQKDFGSAIGTFNKYLQNTGADKATQRADAYNRLGDCYFYNRNYVTADQFYKKAIETDKQHGDYALYHSAVVQGLMRDYTGKATTLQHLIAQHPGSSYTEQAHYELGRSFVAQEKNNEAVEIYGTLIKRYPKSSFARRAAAETAMIYNQQGNYSKAIAAYKQIIRNYPHSEEAQIAAQDLKNIYVEQGKIEEYATFAASTPGMKAMESSERDTLTYTAAERIYSRQKYAEARDAFKNYLNEFPDGSFTIDCHYYLGLIFYNQKASNDALAHFEQVMAFPGNKYCEDAMALSSEIYYKANNHRKALDLYKKLISITDDEERRKACRMNMMRCAYAIEESNDVIEAATALLASDNISPEWEREALYMRAKANLSNKENEKAVKDLAKLAPDTRSKQGAEAKYLLAQIYYNLKEFDKCEKEILNYIEVSTPHAYWLARSFVLLADLYMTQERNMEAKQYLLSLQNNYSGNDDIASMIKERLTKLTDNNQQQ